VKIYIIKIIKFVLFIGIISISIAQAKELKLTPIKIDTPLIIISDSESMRGSGEVKIKEREDIETIRASNNAMAHPPVIVDLNGNKSLLIFSKSTSNEQSSPFVVIYNLNLSNLKMNTVSVIGNIKSVFGYEFSERAAIFVITESDEIFEYSIWAEDSGLNIQEFPEDRMDGATINSYFSDKKIIINSSNIKKFLDKWK